MIEVSFFLGLDDSIEDVSIKTDTPIKIEWVDSIVQTLQTWLPTDKMPSNSYFSAKLYPKYMDDGDFYGFTVSDVICTKKYL